MWKKSENHRENKTDFNDEIESTFLFLPLTNPMITRKDPEKKNTKDANFVFDLSKIKNLFISESIVFFVLFHSLNVVIWNENVKRDSFFFRKFGWNSRVDCCGFCGFFWVIVEENQLPTKNIWQVVDDNDYY